LNDIAPAAFAIDFILIQINAARRSAIILQHKQQEEAEEFQ
jgi:hypothetical protein